MPAWFTAFLVIGALLAVGAAVFVLTSLARAFTAWCRTEGRR